MPEWAWLRDHAVNMSNLDKLTKAAQEATTPFMTRLLTEDHKEVKKGHSVEKLISEFKEISARTARRMEDEYEG
eukprot:9082133-Pyramimonas_sp.AAC.1